MKVKISNVFLHPTEKPDITCISKILNLPEEYIENIQVMKCSVDARRKNNIHFVYSVLAEVCNGAPIKETPEISVITPPAPEVFNATASYSSPPVIAGLGPAGLFCGYILAKYGYNPIIIEQGKPIEERTRDVEKFILGGNLNPLSNIQFGEGGAGTFSDGKLTTRINDSKCSCVLETFNKFGAPDEILYKAKPHIGTDILKTVVKNMREEIIRLGGKVMFESKLTDISHNGKLKSIIINGVHYDCDALVLAIGHSSRDTFDMLYSKGVFMEPKSFAVGVRAEHSQDFINYAQYGSAGEKYGLPPAEYYLKYNGKDRSCYSFCMCPGGEVVPAASEEGRVVTNGMSNYLRNGKFANSGIVVTVSPKDFGGDVFDGVKFQRMLEEKAYLYGGSNYSAPVQKCGDFLKGISSSGSIKTTYARGTVSTDLKNIFPEYICGCLQEGLLNFNKKIPGFAGNDVPLIGVESRTSSPVRITRGDDMQSISVKGIYPCGEGAGYAGGIVSAAVDGIRIAKAIMKKSIS